MPTTYELIAQRAYTLAQTLASEEQSAIAAANQTLVLAMDGRNMSSAEILALAEVCEEVALGNSERLFTDAYARDALKGLMNHLLTTDSSLGIGGRQSDFSRISWAFQRLGELGRDLMEGSFSSWASFHQYYFGTKKLDSQQRGLGYFVRASGGTSALSIKPSAESSARWITLSNFLKNFRSKPGIDSSEAIELWKLFQEHLEAQRSRKGKSPYTWEQLFERGLLQLRREAGLSNMKGLISSLAEAKKSLGTTPQQFAEAIMVKGLRSSPSVIPPKTPKNVARVIAAE